MTEGPRPKMNAYRQFKTIETPEPREKGSYRTVMKKKSVPSLSKKPLPSKEQPPTPQQKYKVHVAPKKKKK